MKPLLALLLVCCALSAQAVTVTLAWDDPNPPGYVTKFTLYEKVWTSQTSATWVKIKDIPANQHTTTIDFDPSKAIKVVSLTAWTGTLESPARAELVVLGPKIPENFKQQ